MKSECSRLTPDYINLTFKGEKMQKQVVAQRWSASESRDVVRVHNEVYVKMDCRAGAGLVVAAAGWSGANQTACCE